MKFEDTIYESELIITGVESYRGKKTSGIRILKNVARRLSSEAREEGIPSGNYIYYPDNESWALAIYELNIQGQGLMVPALKLIAKNHHRYIMNNGLQKEFDLEFDLYGSVINLKAA